jgi:squalene-associated FAD-dependent desaturase
MAQSSKSVVIIGGGVAGIATAVALSDAGFRVQLFEKRPLLGGRASSFVDKATGERVDECQHGTMRCCTNLADLLTRLGVHDKIQYFDAIEFQDSQGRRSAIRGSGLPAPLHTSFSFLTFKSLGIGDKIAIARAMVAMLFAKPRPQQDALDVATWFRRMGQTERALRRFWRPVLVSACNEELERISCTQAFKIFRDGFLLHPQAFHFGVPRVPLATLYTEPTLAYLQQRGGCVRAKTIVQELHFDQGRVTGVSLMDGERVEADYYVSALQFDLLLKLLPPECTTGVAYFENMKHMELSPLCGVHLWFDRPLNCPPALSILDRDTEWIFNKTQNFDLPEGEGTYLSVVISASRRFAETPKEELLAHILEEVRACLPEARQANLVRSHVVRWPKATFSPKVGFESLRPDQRSPIENLYVAGEWTQTGWPSTMESAARSGYKAAEYILEAEGRPQPLVAPDLPVSGFARLFAR